MALAPSLQLHLQAGLELVELEEVDNEEQQHDEVDEEDTAHDLIGRGGMHFSMILKPWRIMPRCGSVNFNGVRFWE
jgi:hypothetical protein